MKKTIKICAIGLSSSIHIVKRTTCFLKYGHDVVVVSPVDHKISGVKNVFVPQNWGRNKLKIFLYIYRLFRAIRNERPDIVHLHSAESYEIVACWLARYPYVVTLMGSDILKKLDGNLHFIRKKMLVFGLKKASLLNSVSDNISNVVRRYVGDNVDIEKAIWGIDLAAFCCVDKAKARKKFSIDEDKIVVLSSRLLKPIYNIDLIIKALPLLKKHLDIQLIVCSYGASADYFTYLKSLVKELDLSSDVIFLDFVENDDMAALYSAADVSVMVPKSDGLPISLLEAMACRVPNIVSALSLYDEIVEDQVSALYVERNPVSIANAISEIVSNERLRLRLIDNAFDQVSLVGDISKDVLKLEKKIVDIVNSPSR